MLEENLLFGKLLGSWQQNRCGYEWGHISWEAG